MSIEGIWTGEIYGPYGWENSGVYILERGMIVGGNNRHYSMGEYSVSGNTYTADILVHYYGPLRTIFGESREEFRVQVTGEIGDGVIEARVVRREKPEFDVHYRMTRRMDLPAGKT